MNLPPTTHQPSDEAAAIQLKVVNSSISSSSSSSSIG